ncbi:MAG: ATP-binding protein [Xenococcus sp. MO_188.B8]|nr:ATP-binding protein [Xenococcus sp. MO_188.B8]
MLRDLTVQNYRCFEKFSIDGLERVNLFVGNNNSGKTSLLEAIYLLVNPNRRKALMQIIEARDKNIFNKSINPLESILFVLNDLFYREETQKSDFFYVQSSQELENRIDVRFGKNKENQEILLFANIFNGEKNNYSFNFATKIMTNDDIRARLVDNNIFLSSDKQDFFYLATWWDSIQVTPKECKIIDALRIIEPDVERIAFPASQYPKIIRLKIKNKNSPVSLSSMGEGMYRVLTLAMSLVIAENGVLLVDEIETGLHYEAQTDMWRLILETAKELNVQVFATTHSWDCIAAFQEALEQVKEQSIGKLFRLDSKYGKLRAVEYNAEDLEIAVRQSIEVR